MTASRISAAALVLAAIVAPGRAEAAAAHCYDRFGGPIGPLYDADRPDTNWIRWVQNRGGTCRLLTRQEAAIFEGRPQGYPPDYAADAAPAAPPAAPAPPPPAGPLRSQPPTTEQSVWLGDTRRAATLVTARLAQAGRPAAAVADTGRLVYRADGVWRVYEARWRDGRSRLMAVHMRPGGEYFVMESDGGQGWSGAVPLGR